MKKTDKRNGTKMTLYIPYNDLISGNWTPFGYRMGTGRALSDFVHIEKVGMNGREAAAIRHHPIEYRDISRGNEITFHLELLEESSSMRCRSVSADSLLFGSMRAYLGNVIVTPQTHWVGVGNNTFFPVGSEFFLVSPHDGFIYYWWALLKSPTFLNRLPVGTGGTRPRLEIDYFSHIPVSVTSLQQRKRINTELEQMAERAWRDLCEREKVLRSVG